MAVGERLHSDLIDDFDLELQALYENIIAEEQMYLLSLKQVTTLASMMSSGLEDNSRENRLDVLRILVGSAVFLRTGGYEIKSTKNLPGEVASILIDMLKENDTWELSTYGKQLLRLAEERAKAGAISDTD